MKSENINESLEKEIFSNSFNLSTDYAQLSLALILKDDILKQFPIMKSLIAFYNITSSIIARHNVKKIIVFLQEFHSQKIENEKLEKFRKKFTSKHKFREEVLETILVMSERFVEIEQSKIFANLFRAYIEENISWKDFQKLSFILNNLNPASYIFLENSIEKNKPINIIDSVEGEALLMACGIGSKFEDRFHLTKTGRQLYEFGLKLSTVPNKVD